MELELRSCIWGRWGTELHNCLQFGVLYPESTNCGEYLSLSNQRAKINPVSHNILTMTVAPVQTRIVHVPHLGGIDAGTYMPETYNPSKPTLVLCHSWGTTVDLYRYQYQNENIKRLVNLLAVDLLGHGQTRAESEHFTYWDSAIMNLQVLDALNITGRIFVLGTSQGGWQTVRMALLAPERVSNSIKARTRPW